MLKWSLIPLGLMTAVVISAPQLVVLGYFLLIIPGLILTLIPTLFVYLLAIWLIRLALRRPPSIATTSISFALAAVLGIAVIQPLRLIEQNKFQQASLPELLPTEKLSLAGSVLLDWTAHKHPRETDISCDFLCLALLDTPGVTSVIRRTNQGIAVFRRGSQQIGELIMPENPEEILKAFYKVKEDLGSRQFDKMRNSEDALRAAWALRIANGDELRREPLQEIPAVDWTIQLVQMKEPGQPQVNRLEIRDKQGQVLARKSSVQHFIYAPMFYVGFECRTLNSAKFQVGGRNASNQPRFYDFDGAVELLRLAKIAEPNPSHDLVDQLRTQLLKTLSNPQATDAQLLLAPMWLSQFNYDAGNDEVDIIERILLDERIPEPHLQLSKALSSKIDMTPLRLGLARRYLRATDSRAKAWYINALIELPAGTFAQPTPEERQIWARSLTEKEAAPFIERLADQGAAGVAESLSLLDAVLTRPWHERWRVLDGVRESLARAGRQAESAIPQIQTLLATTPRSPLLNGGSDRNEWLVALNRMGVPLNNLPYGPRARDPAQLQTVSKRIQNLVTRYESKLTAVPSQ